jgi:hypothetical protein
VFADSDAPGWMVGAEEIDVVPPAVAAVVATSARIAANAAGSAWRPARARRFSLFPARARIS